MSAESKGYTIYHLKTGRAVARLGSGGMLQDDGDPSYLAAFIRRLPYISYYEARPDERMNV